MHGSKLDILWSAPADDCQAGTTMLPKSTIRADQSFCWGRIAAAFYPLWAPSQFLCQGIDFLNHSNRAWTVIISTSIARVALM